MHRDNQSETVKLSIRDYGILLTTAVGLVTGFIGWTRHVDAKLSAIETRLTDQADRVNKLEDRVLYVERRGK